jgi:hypothetical protein
MIRQLESLGSRLLGLFVPQVEASAATAADPCWNACWQCNRTKNGPCNCNAPCCRRSGGNYVCNCIKCP